jgi:hypothetical protein
VPSTSQGRRKGDWSWPDLHKKQTTPRKASGDLGDFKPITATDQLKEIRDLI